MFYFSFFQTFTYYIFCVIFKKLICNVSYLSNNLLFIIQKITFEKVQASYFKIYINLVFTINKNGINKIIVLKISYNI